MNFTLENKYSLEIYDKDIFKDINEKIKLITIKLNDFCLDYDKLLTERAHLLAKSIVDEGWLKGTIWSRYIYDGRFLFLQEDNESKVIERLSKAFSEIDLLGDLRLHLDQNPNIFVFSEEKMKDVEKLQITILK